MRGCPGGADRCVSLATSTGPVAASISEVRPPGPAVRPARRRPPARGQAENRPGWPPRPAGGPAPAHRTARVISPACPGQGGRQMPAPWLAQPATLSSPAEARHPIPVVPGCRQAQAEPGEFRSAREAPPRRSWLLADWWRGASRGGPGRRTRWPRRAAGQVRHRRRVRRAGGHRGLGGAPSQAGRCRAGWRGRRGGGGVSGELPVLHWAGQAGESGAGFLFWPPWLAHRSDRAGTRNSSGPPPARPGACNES
jgi:hypothetical protein